MAKETFAVTENRAAIITGGSGGLGRNTAVNLARRGVDIIFTYRANRLASCWRYLLSQVGLKVPTLI